MSGADAKERPYLKRLEIVQVSRGEGLIFIDPDEAPFACYLDREGAQKLLDALYSFFEEEPIYGTDGMFKETAEVVGPDPYAPASRQKVLPTLLDACRSLTRALRSRRQPTPKRLQTVIALRIDEDVLQAYMKLGKSWQARMNEDLRRARKVT